MSRLLQQAFDRVSQLPEIDQDAIASLIFQEIESEERWDALFAKSESADLLSRLADQALEGARAGRAKKLDLGDL